MSAVEKQNEAGSCQPKQAGSQVTEAVPDTPVCPVDDVTTVPTPLPASIVLVDKEASELNVNATVFTPAPSLPPSAALLSPRTSPLLDPRTLSPGARSMLGSGSSPASRQRRLSSGAIQAMHEIDGLTSPIIGIVPHSQAGAMPMIMMPPPMMGEVEFFPSSSCFGWYDENGLVVQVPQEVAVMRQVEFYFSNRNLKTDKFMLLAMNKREDQAVSLEQLASFNRMKKLCKDQSILVNALKQSDKLTTFEEDGTQFVKRTSMWKPLPGQNPANGNDNPKKMLRRTLYAHGLPPDSSRSSVELYFGVHGKVQDVEFPIPGDTTQCYVQFEKQTMATRAFKFKRQDNIRVQFKFDHMKKLKRQRQKNRRGSANGEDPTFGTDGFSSACESDFFDSPFMTPVVTPMQPPIMSLAKSPSLSPEATVRAFESVSLIPIQSPKTTPKTNTRKLNKPKQSPKMSPRMSPKMSPKLKGKKTPKLSPSMHPKTSPKLRSQDNWRLLSTPETDSAVTSTSSKKQSSPMSDDWKLDRKSPKLSPKLSPKPSPTQKAKRGQAGRRSRSSTQDKIPSELNLAALSDPRFQKDKTQATRQKLQLRRRSSVGTNKPEPPAQSKYARGPDGGSGFNWSAFGRPDKPVTTQS